jgi:pyruvate dehydrogenase E1 component alpha subunit
MLLARRLDERILILHRQGRIATALSNRGQEAVALGAAFALGPGDWMVPYFRELAAYLWRGWKPAQLILYLAGYAEGMAIPPGARDLPLCIPVASQLPHAVGLAYASQHRGEDSVALAFLGDGATSHGDFHEAMNFAGVFQAPVVFCCANNQWAISVPVTRQTRARTLARKAQAYGMAGIQVDGNDLLAVYAATREAVERARAGGGPTFIECLTYRIGAHSTADDPRRYRQETETREWEARDPLARFRGYVEARGLLDAAAHDALDLRLGQEIHAAVAEAEARMQVQPLAIFDHLGPLTAELHEQRGELVRELADTSSART